MEYIRGLGPQNTYKYSSTPLHKKAPYADTCLKIRRVV